MSANEKSPHCSGSCLGLTVTMQSFTPPPPLSLSGNLAENWRKWEQRLNLYLAASGLNDKAESRKIAVLLHCIGEEALEIYNTLIIQHADPEDKKLSEVLRAFEAYCAPRKNTVFERHQFWAHRFDEGAGIDKFVTELRQRARNCEFKETEDLMIRDKIVFSVTDSRLREKLLSTTDLDLTKAIDICRAKEITSAQAKVMSNGANTTYIHAIEKSARKAKPSQPARAQLNKQPSRSHDDQINCGKCGKSHKPRSCPAIGAECRKCGKRNHFAAVCKAGKSGGHRESMTKGVDTLFIGTINQICTKDTGWNTNLRIGKQTVSFKLDTGAEANVLPQTVADRLPRQYGLEKTGTLLIAYGGARIRPKGVLSLPVRTQHKQAQLKFFVTDASDTPLLGREACVELDLIRKVDTVAHQTPPRSREELLKRYAPVFQGLGEFPGVHHIYTDPNIPPVVHGCRKIPFSVLERLRETLSTQEERGVIRKVTKPTQWVSSLVVTEKKNGTLRVCLDPKDLNKAIQRQHFSIPTPEDVQRQLAGKKLFTILDEKDGYWQVKLDDSSADLCTFNTPWGRYQFTRLPFGIKSASEVFQQINSESFGDITGVHIIADDMIIAAETKEEHDCILQQVMDRAKELNVKFNADKIQYMVSEVKYMGHIISAHGVRVDSSKVAAITQMPPPVDKKGLQRLLGMTRFLAQHIPDEATLTAPLRTLLRKDIEWQWHPEHQAALDKLKAVISNAPQLRFYDPKEAIEIQADASKDGLGAVLMQGRRPIAFASRALSGAEQNYAQIEKELLAIVFALRKFHQYVYGVPVKVQSDHKPLEPILTKPIGKAPARLQRMLLQIQKYDIQVRYTPGKDMLIADTLSRAVAPTTTHDEGDLGDDKVIYAVTTQEPLEGAIMQQLRAAMDSDTEVQLLMKMHRAGWPDKRKSVPIRAQPYWQIRDQIRIEDGLVMVDNRIIIPRGCRSEVLKRLHAAHQGIQRTLAHARGLVYWPGLTNDVHMTVESCIACQEKLPSNHKEPLLPHKVPEMPWEKVGADIFEYKGHPYLLIVDYYSKYPEVLNIPDKTSGAVIGKFKAVFARHGTPVELVADHVPFASAEMNSFAKEWGFKITHSSPAFPQSNGMAERTIQTVKNMLKTAEKTGVDPHMALLHLRNTPITGMTYSPAQLLMCRVLRSNLPVSKATLTPMIPAGARQDLEDKQARQKRCYDKTASPFTPFKGGERVCMETAEGWKPATVVRVRDEPRSYDIITPAGACYRRNRKHLRPDRAEKYKDTHMEPTNKESGMEQEEELPEPADTQTDRDSRGTVKHDGHMSEGSQPNLTTRAGRVVRPPIKLQDYVSH